MQVRAGLMLIVIFVAALLVAPVSGQASEADLSAIKTYLLEKTDALQEATNRLNAAAQSYYQEAEAAEFDYDALWDSSADTVAPTLLEAKDAWFVASPLYEQMEGIVAGVPSLSTYDVILDAGTSAEEDPESAVPFDLTLPDGTVLEKPGNLFGLLEATLWGTREEFTSGVSADLNGNGELEFGEELPEANMLLASAQAMKQYTDELADAANEWEPTDEDAFTALVVMIPTMSEYFGSWKESRFVMGDEATRTDFAVISRLSDIQDILSGLQVVYTGVSPLVTTVDAEQDEQIAQNLADLKAYVADIFTQENEGRRFTPEEADFFGSEAQDRAQAIAGQIVQVGALLDIPLDVE
jgi:hypothetical protein